MRRLLVCNWMFSDRGVLQSRGVVRSDTWQHSALLEPDWHQVQAAAAHRERSVLLLRDVIVVRWPAGSLMAGLGF